MYINSLLQHATGWRAIQARPCYEKMAARLLVEKGYQVFLPLYVSRRKRSDRYVDVSMPLFPTYLFCHCDGSRLSPVLNTSGVVRVLGMRDNPAIIEDAEIERLAAMTQSNLDLQPWEFIEYGQKVRIQSGPLCGVEGILVGRDQDKRRLLVSITLLRRSATVPLNPEWITADLTYGSNSLARSASSAITGISQYS